MPKPFLDRLGEYFAEIGKVLRGEATIASIFPNTTDIGVARERIYKTILEQHLPSSCNVALGGYLFNQNGNESAQMDILITTESSLQFNFHNRDRGGKSFACVDGCVAVVSVKSRLDSEQLRSSLRNIATIPNKEPPRHSILGRLRNYDDWPYKIIYASDGVRMPTLVRSLDEFYTANSHIPFGKRPNLIHVAGKYVIVRADEGDRLDDGTVLEPNTFHAMSQATDGYALFWAITNIQRVHMASTHIDYSYLDLINRIRFV